MYCIILTFEIHFLQCSYFTEKMNHQINKTNLVNIVVKILLENYGEKGLLT